MRLDVDPASGRGFLTGDAVNTAARLQAAAPPGGVVVGALTHRAHRARHRLRGAAAGRGQGQGGAGARLAAPRRPIARTGLRTSGLTATPFLGREDGARVPATTSWAAPRSTAHGRVVLVVGEPGIGKSRLVLEFARSPRRASRHGHLAAGALPALRRGGHVLGPRRDRQGRTPASSTPTMWRPSRPKLEAVLPEGEDGRGCGSACARCSASRRRRPRARRTSPPGRASSS